MHQTNELTFNLSALVRYYALSAVSALLKYVEFRHVVFAPHSLGIRYTPIDGTMLIDTETTRNLELLRNLGHNGKKSVHSMFGYLYSSQPLHPKADSFGQNFELHLDSHG